MEPPVPGLRYETSKALRSAVRTGTKAAKLLSAAARGRRFYCRALAGESTYNLTINADLSVSCNCNDTYGRGRLGDLGRNSFRDVMLGPVADGFRAALADGRLPIPECATCSELAVVPPAVARERRNAYRDPAGVQIETTGGCNLACIGCERNERPLSRLTMPGPAVQRIAAELGAMGLRRISLFSLNEPFLSKSILRDVRTLRAALPDAHFGTSTNGTMLDGDDKRRAALLMDNVVFSIDGCDQESAERYQVGTDFQVAYDNMRALVRARAGSGGTKPQIVWKYVLFRWNQREEQVRRAIDLAREAGVDRIVFVFTLTPLYAVATGYVLDRFWKAIGTRRGKWHWVDPRRPERDPERHVLGR